MASKITISASDVWGYFQEKKEDLKLHMHQIANNPEYGITIFITENIGLPNIIVNADDVRVYEELAFNANDCQKITEKIYDKYLTSKVIASLSGGSDDNNELTDTEIEDIIDERESELDDAVYEFVTIATQDAYFDCITSDFYDTCEDLKEHFLEYMARKHDIPVYRPMILEYDDGTEAVSEYPYEDMEFEDPDNPLYKV